MRFLEPTFIWEWCRERGVGLDGEPDPSRPTRLTDDSDLPHRARLRYAEGHRSGREPEVAALAVAGLGAWDECLVWITEWGVWPSGEDWPRFYAFRARHGERFSLSFRPGHLLDPAETAELVELLTLVMENGWDATVLPAIGGRAIPLRLVISHDEWAELRSGNPVRFGPLRAGPPYD